MEISSKLSPVNKGGMCISLVDLFVRVGYAHQFLNPSFYDDHFDRRTKLVYMRSLTCKNFSEALFRISLSLKSHQTTRRRESYHTESMIVELIQDLWIPLFEFLAPQKPCEGTRVLSSLQRSALNKFKDEAAKHISVVYS